MWVVTGILILILLGMLYREYVLYRAEQAINEIIGVDPEDEVSKLEQIANIKQEGITFRSSEKEHDFIFDYSNNFYYASHPYYALLTDAGDLGLLSNVYGISDRECVDQNAYRIILEGLDAISGIGITNISSEDRYCVTFELDGKLRKWKAKKQGDWVDHRLASYLNRFLSADQLFFTDSTHEGIIYFFGSQEQAERLNQRFGLHFTR